MSRFGKWLGAGTIAGLLLILTACGKKEAPPQANSETPSAADGQTAVDGAPPSRLHGEGSVHQRNERQGPSFDPIAPPDDAQRIGVAFHKSAVGEQNEAELSTFLKDLNSRWRYRPPTAQMGQAATNLAEMRALTRAREERFLRTMMQVEQAGRPGQVAIEGAEDGSTENYQPIFDNPFKLVKYDALSTISSAVDTAAYSNIRARLNAGTLPPKDAVRIADMLNYFNYDYAGPKNDDPVAFSLEIAPCPWQPKHHLLRVGLKAKTIDKDKMPPRNLTFLIDTSGSMDAPNRLPLIQQSLRLLVNELTALDRVAIVTYAGSAELLLTPTPGDQKDKITRVIDSLNPNGSTNGGGGLVMAYDQAKASFIKEGVNRVVLATDGDFNVGISSDAEMVRLIEEKRNTGVYLTVLGYGMGNLKDSKLEQLAHHGNGHYAYIDTLDEAKKVFVEQGGSLVTVAKDVKLQVEFNPMTVSAYRLIGYENRILRHEDFRNDKKDAGDMGSGHMCTALYEVVPVGEKVESGDVEPLKYQTAPKLSDAAKSGEWGTVRMRYKHPETEKAKEVAAALPADALGKKVSNDFEFAACVASFGMLLRDSEHKGVATYASCLETAQGLVRDKKDAHREEFVKLVRVALTIDQKKEKPPMKID